MKNTDTTIGIDVKNNAFISSLIWEKYKPINIAVNIAVVAKQSRPSLVLHPFNANKESVSSNIVKTTKLTR